MYPNTLEQCSANFTVEELFPEYVKNVELIGIFCIAFFLYCLYKIATAKNKDDEYQERKIKEEVDLDSKILRMSEEEPSHKNSYDQYQNYKQCIRELENEAELFTVSKK